MFLASQKKEEENLKKAGLVLEKIREIRDVGKRRLWSESYLDWVKDNWSSRGQKLNFIERKYLVQIYQDQSQEIVLKKSAQSGGTERMVTEAVWLADQRPKNSLYLFPTSATMADLVQERVDTPLNASPYLRDIAARGKKIISEV
jgi:hypothetical protein